MNDVMSGGIHRYWKNYFVQELGNLSPSNLYTYSKTPKNIQILDVAGGTGDISFKILDNHYHSSIFLFYADIKATVLDVNQSMLD